MMSARDADLAMPAESARTSWLAPRTIHGDVELAGDVPVG
jgi:hypothetical protein